jgi:hypothetical protein
MVELDHVVHYVQDLDTARSQYKELGFVTQEGGKHSYGTQNIVTRVHRGYIEPITIVDWDLLRERRPMSVFNLLHEVIAGGGGAISFGLAVRNIEHVARHLENEGMKFTLRQSSIQRHDGTQKSWKYILLDEGPSKWNPFIIDYGVPWEERASRYGTQDDWTISRIVIETEAPEEYGHWIARIVGSSATQIDGGVRVTIKNGDVDVVKGSAERITRVLFKESDAPVGHIQGLSYGVDL